MSDLPLLQGTWDVLRLEQDGKSAPDAPLVKMVIFKDDRMFLRYVFPRSADFVDEMAQVKLDGLQSPKAIEQMVDAKTYRGIYAIEDDTLRICWRRTVEASAPRDFVTERGSDCRLLVLKRKESTQSGPTRAQEGSEQ